MTQAVRRIFLIKGLLARKLRGLSKDELAGMIGVSAGEIVNYEKQFQEIYDDQAQKLADV